MANIAWDFQELLTNDFVCLTWGITRQGIFFSSERNESLLTENHTPSKHFKLGSQKLSWQKSQPQISKASWDRGVTSSVGILDTEVDMYSRARLLSTAGSCSCPLLNQHQKLVPCLPCPSDATDIKSHFWVHWSKWVEFPWLHYEQVSSLLLLNHYYHQLFNIIC